MRFSIAKLPLGEDKFRWEGGTGTITGGVPEAVSNETFSERFERVRTRWIKEGRLHHLFLCSPACEGILPQEWDSDAGRTISLHGYKDPSMLRQVYLDILSRYP